MQEYFVVTKTNLSELMDSVEELLNKGFICQGGICSDSPWYYQAMIGNHENKEDKRTLQNSN